MKHISKKYLNQRLLTNEEQEKLSSHMIPYDERIHNMTFDSKEHVPFVSTTNNYIIQAFEFKEGNERRFLPEPDQVLIYFNSAYNSYRQLEPIKKKLLDKTLPNGPLNEGTENEIYNLFGQSSGFVIFLFSAVEAFMNRMIPDDFIFSEISGKKTELYNKEQIQRYLSFDTKYSKVLPQITNLNFKTKFPTKHTILWNLKDFRDELIHPKQRKGPSTYELISKKALKFKYAQALEVVRDYINFYKNDFIEECQCGLDY
jgi:hypothetical protein